MIYSQVVSLGLGMLHACISELPGTMTSSNLFVCLMVLYVLLRLFDAAFGSAGDSSLTFSDQANSRQRHLFKYVNDGGWHHIPVEFFKNVYSKIL